MGLPITVSREEWVFLPTLSLCHGIAPFVVATIVLKETEELEIPSRTLFPAIAGSCILPNPGIQLPVAAMAGT